jgi:hypothetical protein
LQDIIVDEVPDPTVSSHCVPVGSIYSLISSGTETASIHKEGVARAVANDPSQIKKVWNALKDSLSGLWSKSKLKIHQKNEVF